MRFVTLKQCSSARRLSSHLPDLVRLASWQFGFRVLHALGAVSQAVANSAKRIVVLFFAVYFLGEAASTQKLVGAGVAILGVLMYSLAKMEAEKRAAAKKK